MRSRLRALLDILDFFVPLEVVTSIFLIFVGEMIFERIIGEVSVTTLVMIYLAGIFVTSILRYLSADEEEREDLTDDIDDL